MSATGKRVAEQTYKVSDLARLFQIPVTRVRELQQLGEIPPADFILPLSGRQGERWLASTIAGMTAKWSMHVPAEV